MGNWGRCSRGRVERVERGGRAAAEWQIGRGWEEEGGGGWKERTQRGDGRRAVLQEKWEG